MLGKHHLTISILTIVPLALPLIFGGYDSALIYGIVFILAVSIGSLLPDADCGGNATLYYRFKPIDIIMKKVVIKLTVFLFNIQRIRENFSTQDDIKEEHRGIMHSPIGVAVSSLFLTIILSILLLLFQQFNVIFIVMAFVGFLVGQFMHLLEDSLTVSGIDWKFPFGSKLLRGKIYTFRREKEKVDIRPMIFQYLLLLVSVILILNDLFKTVQLPIWLTYVYITGILAIVWLTIYKLSSTQFSFWTQDAKIAGAFRKRVSFIKL